MKQSIVQTPSHLPLRATPASRVQPANQITVAAGRNEAAGQRSRLETALALVRAHQWSKNLLLFVPLITSHKLLDASLLLTVTVAFLSFNLVASSAYVLNDLIDLETDRQHPRKRFRPLAAGLISTRTALVLIPLLAGAGLVVATFLNKFLGATLIMYILSTLAYSCYLKRILVVDILVLAGLYSIRIFSGGVVANIVVSPWLLAFSMFLFLSLAFVKRYSELQLMSLNGEPSARGRSYLTGDIDLLGSIGVTSGYLSVLVLALYVSSSDVVTLYHHPKILWFSCPLLLYWITRVWFLARRGQMHEDPVIFALRDRVSYGVSGLVGLVLLASI